MKAAHVLVALSLVCLGCATPPEVKQALISKDQAYAENARLMNIHRELLVNIDQRYWYWYRYTKQLALLDNALKWATTDPDPPETLVEKLVKEDSLSVEKAREQARLRHVTAVRLALGQSEGLLKIINMVRLKDLPERKDKGGAVVFEKGHGDMNKLVQGIPELISAIHKSMESEYKEENKGTDFSAFDDYQTNLAALRRINGMVKRYLDIDLTVNRDNLNQIAESVKALR